MQDVLALSGAEAPGLELIDSKLRRPATRARSVLREELLARLTRPVATPIVAVVAPAGYGKTTLLTQWADADARSFAWVSVDEDDDPRTFLSYVAAALNQVEPISPIVFEALASPITSIHRVVVPRLAAAFRSMRTSMVLVIDDVHLLHHTACIDALCTLGDQVPEGSQLVLSGRSAPPVRIARLRAQERLTEVGREDLTMTRSESAQLLRSLMIVDDARVDDLHTRTEGWPVALYLTALHLTESGSVHRAADAMDRPDRFVSEYVTSELIDPLIGSQREFLTRTSVLEQLSAPLCEAVLGDPAAAELLAEAAACGLIVPLDDMDDRYRHHRLLRAQLRAELDRREPGRARSLQVSAAAWHEEHAEPEAAVEYSIAAGDDDAVARLLPTVWATMYRHRRFATLQRWFDWLDGRAAMESRPINVVNAGLLAMANGQADRAEHWSATVDDWWRDGVASRLDLDTAAAAVAFQAMSCRRGVERMRVDADQAAQLSARAHARSAVAPLLQGVARMLAGDERADDFLADAEIRDGAPRPDELLAVTRVERALLAIGRDDWRAAERLADRAGNALREAEMLDSYAAPLVDAVHARAALHRKDVYAARNALDGALRRRHLLTVACPHLALQCRLMIVRVQLGVDDVAGARAIMREIDDIFSLRPSMGSLAGEADELRAHLASVGSSITGGAVHLTAAELRILPMLGTHMTYSEIAAALFVSTNTVKTQAYSLFRKLGASSRGEAVALSRELALLEV